MGRARRRLRVPRAWLPKASSCGRAWGLSPWPGFETGGMLARRRTPSSRAASLLLFSVAFSLQTHHRRLINGRDSPLAHMRPLLLLALGVGLALAGSSATDASGPIAQRTPVRSASRCATGSATRGCRGGDRSSFGSAGDASRSPTSPTGPRRASPATAAVGASTARRSSIAAAAAAGCSGDLGASAHAGPQHRRRRRRSRLPHARPRRGSGPLFDRRRRVPLRGRPAAHAFASPTSAGGSAALAWPLAG